MYAYHKLTISFITTLFVFLLKKSVKMPFFFCFSLMAMLTNFSQSLNMVLLFTKKKYILKAYVGNITIFFRITSSFWNLVNVYDILGEIHQRRISMMKQPIEKKSSVRKLNEENTENPYYLKIK